MIAALFGLLGALVLPLAQGTAFHYDSGAFRRVAAVRGMALAPNVDGYAASPSCRYVDPARPYVALASLYSPRTHRWEPAKVFEILDCAAPADLQRHYRALEVDAHSAAVGGWAYPPGAGHTSVKVFLYRRLDGGTP